MYENMKIVSSFFNIYSKVRQSTTNLLVDRSWFLQVLNWMAWPLSLGQAASKKIRKIEKSKNDPSRKANTGE
jgi:hypothetical protein